MKTIFITMLAISPRIIFGLTFSTILFILLYLNAKYGLFRDDGTQPLNKRTYSFSRLQLAWWTLILLSCISSIIFTTGQLPVLYQSTLILLGIAGVTTGAARIIDVANQKAGVNNDAERKGFIMDVLSSNGISVDGHRLQCFLINLLVGGYFIEAALKNSVVPDLPDMYLALTGLSGSLYIFMKNKE